MAKNRHRLSLLIPLVLLLVAGGARLVTAQDVLGLGQVLVEPTAGYGGYALPVANSALARDWAASSGMAWQIAYNYATIPVFVHIEHRQPMARRIRVSVESEHAYAAEELENAGYPSSTAPVTVVSREVLVPPSVPVDLALLPRCCPPSRPGRIQNLTVRVEMEGQPQPFVQPVEVIQLEPTHLYSLYLDGPPGVFFSDTVNPANHLRLEPPSGGAPGQMIIPRELLTSRHYLLGVPHAELTLAPLAGRDFAFCLANLDFVRSWSAADQQALLAYVIGGGRLCLFNAAGDWQNLDLDSAALPVGRGFVVPVHGDLDSARQAMTGWLEGEFSELVAWCRGTVDGRMLPKLGVAGNLANQLNILSFFHGDAADAGITPHRPGFLHPLWIYRESCFDGALEPWDFPEFSTNAANVLANNINLRTFRNQFDELPARLGPPVRPLLHCLGEARALPIGLITAGIVLPISLLVAGRIRRRTGLALGLVAGAFLLAGPAWWLARPADIPPLHCILVDAQAGQATAVQRELVVARSEESAEANVAVTPGALVRRVGGPDPVAWQLVEDPDGSHLRWPSAKRTIAAVLDTCRQQPVVPVTLAVSRESAQLLAIKLDTRRLPADRECYLQTPYGWQVIPGGRQDQTVHISQPANTAWPGLERLDVWEHHLDWWLPDSPRFGSLLDVRDRAMLQYQIQRLPGPAPGAGRQDLLQHAQRLCWMGVCQLPCGIRGALTTQGVLYIPLDPAELGASEPEHTVAIMRYTFDLEPAR
ncbi:hypothetical protein JW859_13605 [bacterium]|nr:hypothetical protein [bacterium]